MKKALDILNAIIFGIGGLCISLLLSAFLIIVFVVYITALSIKAGYNWSSMKHNEDYTDDIFDLVQREDIKR